MPAKNAKKHPDTPRDVQKRTEGFRNAQERTETPRNVNGKQNKSTLKARETLPKPSRT